MPEIKRWSGNTTTEISLKDNELDNLIEFIKNHKHNFIFGEGKIGSAIMHYLGESGIEIDGHINSETLKAFKEKYKKTEYGLIIGISDIYYDEVVPKIKSDFFEGDIFFLSSNMRETMGNAFSIESVEKNFWINIYITNQCNLNCKSCSAFAPICNTADYYEKEEFERDINQIKKLNLSNISVFKFTGAEAFLHPQIFDIFKIARNVFCDKEFECYTNGLALFTLEDKKFELLRELNITLVITEYPVNNLSLEKIYDKLDKHNIKYSIIYSEGQKYFSKRPLNFKKDTPKHLFYYCPRYRMCDSLFLFKGKLFKCIYSLSYNYINEAFDKKLQIEKSDYLDIYSIETKDIYKYVISRLPFCGYCSPIEELVPWGLSEKDISEWS